ncbi:MAG: nucleotide exchange factor GrpE [Bacteroidetes bacterium HGW-Bacteroidetes-2]|jgi:molecular chaperone GrpE|nr:MAG: nucleotide exchange factor GrpE [Bacteroidetes bacterium HGW-Bacteroidetes-2]
MSKKNKQKETEATKIEDINPATVENNTDVENVTAEEIISVEEELIKEKERFLRLFAEFENYKKRTNKERIELFKTAGQEVIQSLLPVLDDFDRALIQIEKEGNDSLFQGVQLINNKLKETLKSKGLQIVEVQQGEIFNADNHEAITQIPAPSEDLKGKIIDVVEKGYTIGDKVLRYPKVIIGQ